MTIIPKLFVGLFLLTLPQLVKFTSFVQKDLKLTFICPMFYVFRLMFYYLLLLRV